MSPPVKLDHGALALYSKMNVTTMNPLISTYSTWREPEGEEETMDMRLSITREPHNQKEGLPGTASQSRDMEFLSDSLAALRS